MKLITLLLLIGGMQVFATSYAQEKISLQLKETTMKQLLKEVEKQTGYRFVYHNKTLPEDLRVSVTVSQASLKTVLANAFAGTPLAWSMKDNGLVVIYADKTATAAAITVKGKVTGADNLPLPGVTVRVTGTNTGTLTDAAGQYTLAVPEGTATLEFSLVGYVKQKVAVSNRQVINIVLETDVQTLNSVTVTGYTNYTRDRSASAASVVSAEKIGQIPMATFDQVLQGRVPGLNVSAGSGQPGTSGTVVLRGIGTLNGSSALLYVVDGVPVEPNYLQAINPADIASVTVLKDAASKAMYGSRGANGVMVISTKKGTKGKLAVEYRSQYGFSDLTTPKYTMMNTRERLQFEEEVGLETGVDIGPGWAWSKKNPAYAALPLAEQQQLDHRLDSLGQLQTNWRDILLRRGKFMEQQVSASGGNDNVRFYTSLNYYKQDGIVMRSGLERYTLKNNMDFNFGRLTGNVNLGLGYAKSNFIEREGSSKIGNPIAASFYALPYEYPYAPDGTLITSENKEDYGAPGDREGGDALEGMLHTYWKSNQVKGMLSTSLNYAILPGLTAKTRLGVDFRENTDERFIDPDSYSGRKVSNGSQGSFGEEVVRNTAIISTSGLTYANIFAKKHDVEVSGYFEYIRNHHKGLKYTGYGLDGRLPGTPAGIPGGALMPDLQGKRTGNSMNSYILVGRYTYDNRYSLNASFRYDGSSTVPQNNRWHSFYSVGLGWEAKRERFLQDVAFISNLRFRASYGTTASPFGSDFGYAATYALTQYAGNAGIIPSKPGFSGYDWEYAKEFNIGFDFAVLENRIRLVADVYNKVTNNLFINQPVSYTSGFSSLLLNSGAMRNRGIEVDLQGDILRRKNLTWTVGVNFAYNKNEITDLGASSEFPQGTTSIARVGLPYGAHFAPRWAGVDPATGDAQYYKRDGSITTTYNEAALSVAEFGTYIPPFTGGIITAVNYKGIYLNALFSFATNTYRYNNEDYYNENPSLTFITSNQSVRMLYDRWKKPGDNALLPRIDSKRGYSSRDIQDASFIRLRNLNIGYRIPESWLARQRYVKGIQVFVQGQNLITWTKWKGMDPEDNNGEGMFDYPNARTYTAGINVNF
ncbi:SusC/RagA family TonB-linked outer membrane protein [Chitinophaga nivalis]|uniref:SusC/RagA family TonB-linked outer membrane protein n=1 Tax=Chitinophaga nivalis TaxID=2991709 RepID=A0ABT3IGY7_9BACT|nr:SusC/RagA family TonB-linked outer membrane protein [Chitinophaga nivalis]MCW3467100.1 SusC/RagA family TonB-linked outer membrane protein [Chitinophaga nivalis]MCW3483209.1 SusC/RagA family TonB-linked outer membrane protein [Chitinophaga nivalis]